MNFHRIKEVGSFATTLILQYRMPNGEQRAQSMNIDNHVAQCSSPAYFEIVEETMRRKAEHEIREFVQNNIRTCTMAPNEMSTAAYNQYETNVMYDVNSSSTTADYRFYNIYENNYVQPTMASGTAYWEAANSLPVSFSTFNRKQKVKIKVGKRFLVVEKTPNDNGEVEITDDDLKIAREQYYKDTQFTIITNRAERKAEDLLKMFVSEVDFRSYKKNGYFTVKQGNRVFRIWRDNHKWVDMWEKDEKSGLLTPKNRLCTHTATREIPLADEVVSKLMLIKSNRIQEHANFHSIDADMKECKESELVLV